MKQSFSEFINKFYTLPEPVLTELVNLFVLREIKKKDFMMVEGKKSDELAFISSGFFRAFINKEGIEITTDFYFSPTLFADIKSYKLQIPATLNVQALEDSTIYVTSISSVRALGEKHPEVFKLFLSFIEHIYIFSNSRQYSLLMDSPEVRYQKLFKERPKVINNIPLQYIATYLGMKPETLSRIRRKIN